MLEPIKLDSSYPSFYKLGFIVLAVSGGIVLLISVSRLIHRKVGLPEVFGFCELQLHNFNSIVLLNRDLIKLEEKTWI